MNKIIFLIFSVLVICFGVAFYIIAWQEPSQTAPEGNISTPINTGSLPQSKSGRISATEFYDVNDSNYYLNPDGSSNLSGDLNVGNIVIKKDGSISTNLNADKVDDLNAADLLAQSGGGATMVTWGGQQMGSCTSAEGCTTMNIAPGLNAPACPSGWTEAYAGYGPTFFPGSTYYTAGNAVCVTTWRSFAMYLGQPCYPSCNQYGCTYIYCNTCRVCVK